MNIYFSPTERNELNFPTSSLSTNITNSILTIDEVREANNNIDDNLNQEDSTVGQFYKKYGSKKKNFEKTTSQKKLNKVKVYFIVKSKTVRGKKVNFAVPIRNYDDLGNSIIEKSNAFLASLFYIKLDDTDIMYDDEYIIEGSPGARPFILDHLIDTEPPFEAEEEVPLESLILPKKYGVDGVKLDLPADLSINGPINMLVKENFVENAFGDYFSSEYDYTDSLIDNTFLVNVSKYVTDIREKKTFDGEKGEIGFLKRIKDLHLKEDGFKSFNISNLVSLILGDKSASIDKNIIPIFSKLEDAQDLLITILEEINQPFQVRRKVENSTTTEYYRSLNYLDDSFSVQNRYFLPNPNSQIDIIKDLLRKYRLIKSRNIVSYEGNEYYNENNYQTKGPFFVEDAEPVDQYGYVPTSQRPRFAPKFVWRESDYLDFLEQNFPGQPEDYSWYESRDMSEVDKGILKKSQDIKIVSMGLGDFLEFWNNPKEKNAEVLFIPSSDNLNKKKLPLFSKKPRDRFYDYQQKFRGSKKQDTENYNYELKISS